MNTIRINRVAFWARWTAGVLFVVLGAGCVKHPPTKPPVVRPVATAAETVEGTWESHGRNGNTLRMIFKPNGDLSFQGGLEYFNPGRWDFDPMRHLLTLTLPQAPDEKIQIFKLYVGDGVLSFDRPGKRVTFRFDDQTSSLNIAGWIYSRAEAGSVNIPAEPTLK